MPDPIEVNYVPDGDDWQVTVAGRGQRLTARAPGLIAARDRADQLVEKLAPNEKLRTVVHLLEGDALQFTTMYLNARLAKPADADPASPKPAPKPTAESSPTPSTKPSPKPRPEPSSKPTPAPAPRADSDGAPSKTGAEPGRPS
jgi:outer membrane biosynthesis protein TonB